MSIVRVPEPQPNDGTVTVREYALDPKAPWQIVGIHDGWRPLSITSLEHTLILAVLVDTSMPEEAEVFRLLLPGDDMRPIQEAEGVELAFLGVTWDRRYLFLDVKPEPGEPVRRIGRLDLENLQNGT